MNQWLIVAILALALFALFRHRAPVRADNAPVLPSQPGTPDKTKQQPKQVPWRGGPVG